MFGPMPHPPLPANEGEQVRACVRVGPGNFSVGIAGRVVVDLVCQALLMDVSCGKKMGVWPTSNLVILAGYPILCPQQWEGTAFTSWKMHF